MLSSSSTNTTNNDMMRWSLPDIVKGNSKGLSSVSEETLQKCLKPVLDGLERLDAEALLDLERSTAGDGAVMSRDG